MIAVAAQKGTPPFQARLRARVQQHWSERPAALAYRRRRDVARQGLQASRSSRATDGRERAVCRGGRTDGALSWPADEVSGCSATALIIRRDRRAVFDRSAPGARSPLELGAARATWRQASTSGKPKANETRDQNGAADLDLIDRGIRSRDAQPDCPPRKCELSTITGCPP